MFDDSIFAQRADIANMGREGGGGGVKEERSINIFRKMCQHPLT